MPIICATRSGFGLMVTQQNRGLRPCLFYAAPLGLFFFGYRLREKLEQNFK